MTAIKHHISEPLLMAYAAGSLEHHYALVVAAHVSMCDECRAQLAVYESVGGAVMDGTNVAPISVDLKDSVFARLEAPQVEKKRQRGFGVFPAPVMEALKGKPPRWKSLGFGVRQSILSDTKEGSVRLLYIPGGQEVPDHSHEGIELTLVLQGAFRDETGRFGVGDLEIADDDLEHAPIAEEGAACICLAATGAPLRFKSWMPRLFQPIFRI